MLNPEVKQKNPTKKQQQSSATQLYKNAMITLQSTLQKKIEVRTPQDIQTINNFVLISPFFTQLAEEVSADFSRNIVKQSKIFTLNGSKRLQQKGERMQMIYMILRGELYIREEQEIRSDDQVPNLNKVYSSLIKNVKRSHFMKKEGKSLQRRISLVQQTELRTQPVPNFNELVGLKKHQREGKLLIGDLQKQKYIEDLYLKGQGWILALPISSFYKCLLQQYDRLLQHQVSYFRTLRCFDILDDTQLKIFIEKIAPIQYKKDQYVFREGEPSTYLYFLIEGEAKASKNVALFKQDPNTFYRTHNRTQSGRRVEKPQEFAYANFEGVYNYKPKNIKKDIGILSPITIFGQQQISAGIERQVQVQITSTKAKIYCFTLSDLQSSGNGKKIDIQSFLDDLYQSITSKRITVRRKGLSTSLSFQNKRNMNYFYIEQTPTAKKRYSSITYKINNSILPKNTERPKSSVKPRFHNFNFNQFLEEGRVVNTSFTNQQKKVADLTHNANDIAQKVQAQTMLFTQRQSYKHKINVITPLFDSNYYRKQRKQVLRIQNKRRMQMIEVHGISSKKKV